MINTGVYTWQYAGGAFPVTLRPNGVFHCGQFPALASWSAEEQGGIAKRLFIDWKNFGKYEFGIAADGSCLEGCSVGNPSNWRKMTWSRPLNDAEKLLMAGEGGSVWDFQWEKGSFEVEFRVDGYNHFICSSFPEHSHWQMDDGTFHHHRYKMISIRHFGACYDHLTHLLDVDYSHHDFPCLLLLHVPDFDPDWSYYFLPFQEVN